MPKHCIDVDYFKQKLNENGIEFTSYTDHGFVYINHGWDFEIVLEHEMTQEKLNEIVVRNTKLGRFLKGDLD